MKLFGLWRRILENPILVCLGLGANVGFHSITGNWEFDDHIAAVERNIGKVVSGYLLRK